MTVRQIIETLDDPEQKARMEAYLAQYGAAG